MNGTGINCSEQYVKDTQLACKQLSQLTAWSWLTLPAGTEKELQKEFADQMLSLATLSEEKTHQEKEEKFRALLCDDSTEHLTLRQVYKKLTELNNYVFSPDFVKSMGYVVPTGTFTGSYTFDFVNFQFVAHLPYPPKPDIPRFDNVLEEWTQNQEDYVPPSPYIPFHGS